MSRRALLVPLLCGLAVLPATSSAKPAICGRGFLNDKLIAAGKLTREDLKFHAGVDLVRCGDVTDDGVADAVFGVASGGTAGDTHFGVFDGAAQRIILYKQGYKVLLARHSSRAFDVLQPHYAGNDPNCCPSSFRWRRYTWTGSAFRKGRVHRAKNPPARFER